MKSDKPLSGHTILVTRADTAGYRRIEDLGGSLYVYPAIRTVAPEDYSELDRSIEALGTYHWLVFTSANGVRYFMSRLTERGMKTILPESLKVCAIGPKTAAVAGEFGLSVDLMPEAFNADGLIAVFINKAKSVQDRRYKISNLSGLRILLPRAENAGDTFPERVVELDGHIDCPVAYRTVNPAAYDPELADLFGKGEITISTFTSSATFRNFLEAMGEEALTMLRGTIIAAIGPVTVKAIESAGLPVRIIPEKATVEDMVDAIIHFAAG